MTLRGASLSTLRGGREILGARTQPALGGVSENEKRREGREGLGRGWELFFPELAELGAPGLSLTPPHLSQPSPGAAPAPLVGLHGDRGRSHAVSRNALRRRLSWPWRRPLSSSGSRDSGHGARSYSAVSRPAAQTSRRPPPPPLRTRRFRGRGGVLPSRNAHPLHAVTDGAPGGKA